MLSRAWACPGSIRPGGSRPCGNPGPAPGPPALNPGRNWKGEAGAGESFTASWRELGGNRKGGKPRGRPGGKESRFLD